MRYSVSLSDESKRDLADALDYYAKISAVLSQRLFAEVDKVMVSLSKYPMHHPIRYKSIRIASTNNFSYGIHYKIFDKEVKVLRVLHHKQYYASDS